MMSDNKDIAPLIALLKMEALVGRVLKPVRSRSANCSAAIKPYWKCGLKPADALALKSVSFRLR